MSLRDAYKQRLTAQVEEQRARLGALKAKAKRVAADGQIIGYEELAQAERSLGQFASKLKKIAGAGFDALAEMRGGVGKALDDLGTSTKRAAERLSEVTAPPQAQARRRTARQASRRGANGHSAAQSSARKSRATRRTARSRQ